MIGKNWRKQIGQEKFGYRLKTVEMNKVLISVLKPLGFFRCYDNGMTLRLQHTFFTPRLIKVYFVNESYNEEQGIKIIILRTNSFYTERITFPVFSTVRRYITLLQ